MTIFDCRLRIINRQSQIANHKSKIINRKSEIANLKMLTSLVIRLQSAEDAGLTFGNGRAVHGLWFSLWQQVDPELATRLHTQNGAPPFTLSPLMGLPRPRQGHISVRKDRPTWFRITTLTEELSTAVKENWLPALPEEIELAGVRWRVTGYTDDPAEHPWAGRARYSQLANQRLFGKEQPKSWRLRFETPAAFHGSAGHLPFPLPDSLVKSWLRRWNAFAPIALPDDLSDRTRSGVVVSAYNLKTVPVRHGKRLIVGCTGWEKLYTVNLHPAMRAALNLLAHYAFYCGSGAKTTQGMGMTRIED
ncbi:MAG: CRISPR system precrRNA processing endoribonuclease RAMP protein Cas6 [Gammaproteobacteria bacterium]|nr:MAG: CRISPR system precrRNA processing endoribonuclease RAMP protein Cas6 [Gammaproteobacteria bacterium]